MMADTQQQEWPNRNLEILIPTTTLCVLSSLVLIWRLVYGVKQNRKLMLCDYLLILAAVSLFLLNLHNVSMFADQRAIDDEHCFIRGSI